MSLEKLKTWFEDMDEGLYGSLSGYASELLRFNKAINLVSVNTVEKLANIHFADCLLGSQILFKNLGSGDDVIYDIGSGNGFPGLILALLSPSRKVVLVEADQRKAEFLSHMVDFLGLKNTQVFGQPLESLPEGSIQVGVSRAFAPLDKALLQSRRYFASGGKYFHFKTDTWSIETATLPSQVFSIWSTEHLGEYRIPDSEKKHSILLTKKA